jgi:hypothetical protein
MAQGQFTALYYICSLAGLCMIVRSNGVAQTVGYQALLTAITVHYLLAIVLPRVGA